MAKHSFDIVCKIKLFEVDNAINIALKEIYNRYDLKNANIEIKRDDTIIKISGRDEFTVNSAYQVLRQRLAKRNVPLKAIKELKREQSGLNNFILTLKIQEGIEQDKIKQMIKDIKELKIKKIQINNQGDSLRIVSDKIDFLQEVIKFLKEKDYDIALQFVNFK